VRDNECYDWRWEEAGWRWVEAGWWRAEQGRLSTLPETSSIAADRQTIMSYK